MPAPSRQNASMPSSYRRDRRRWARLALNGVPLTLNAGMYDVSAAGKLAVCVSMLCWFSVAYAGRGIAFEVLFGMGA